LLTRVDVVRAELVAVGPSRRNRPACHWIRRRPPSRLTPYAGAATIEQPGEQFARPVGSLAFWWPKVGSPPSRSLANCVVDDAQWLDQEPAQALVFVARRVANARAAFMERATELTGDVTLKAGRALMAAEAKRQAGAFDAAPGLADIAQRGRRMIPSGRSWTFAGPDRLLERLAAGTAASGTDWAGAVASIMIELGACTPPWAG
jgi:hypothetical protein